MNKELCCGRASCLGSKVCCKKNILCEVHSKTIGVKCLCNEISQEDEGKLILENRQGEAEQIERSVLDEYNDDPN